MRQTKQIIIDEITRLSQEEGLRDEEIANILGYNRVSISRIRKTYNIPKSITENRKDKETICPSCGNKYFIRRKEKYSIACPDCIAKTEAKFKKLAEKELQRELNGEEEY